MLRFDAPFVAAMYSLKTITWDEAAIARASAGESVATAPVRFVGTPCEGEVLQRQDGFVTALYAGTGFMMLRRDTLARMIAVYPETRCIAAHANALAAQSPHQDALFDCVIDPETGHYLSEDFTFYQRWRRIGGQIWRIPRAASSVSAPTNMQPTRHRATRPDPTGNRSSSRRTQGSAA
jgi:hypothetical protein